MCHFNELVGSPSWKSDTNERDDDKPLLNMHALGEINSRPSDPENQVTHTAFSIIRDVVLHGIPYRYQRLYTDIESFYMFRTFKFFR
jgi:hypothetical protein